MIQDARKFAAHIFSFTINEVARILNQEGLRAINLSGQYQTNEKDMEDSRQG